MNRKRHGILSFFVILTLNLIFVLRTASPVMAETVVPVKSVDGKILLETGRSAVTDGKYIYYSYQGDGRRMDIIRLEPKSLKEKSIAKQTGNGFTDLAVKGKYVYAVLDKVFGYGAGNEEPYIYRFSKDGKKKKKLAVGKGLVVTDDKIYYFSGKIVKMDEEGMQNMPDFESDGYISSMDFNGKNRKKLIKINAGNKMWFKLFKSGNKVYYMDSDNRKTLKDLEGNKIEIKEAVNAGEIYYMDSFTEYAYDVKTRIKYRKTNDYGNAKLQAGTYTSGKWKYKTLSKYSMIQNVSIFDDYMMAKVFVNVTPDSALCKIYFLDKKGKKVKELGSWVPAE